MWDCMERGGVKRDAKDIGDACLGGEKLSDSLAVSHSFLHAGRSPDAEAKNDMPALSHEE